MSGGPEGARSGALAVMCGGEEASFAAAAEVLDAIGGRSVLLGGPGAALASQTFRLMDPVSQRMMGVRPDMTVQVARIAVTRLKHEPRPLRLSYGGNVIRVRGSALKPERQFAQVGTELIGVDSAEADDFPAADVEALEALTAVVSKMWDAWTWAR